MGNKAAVTEKTGQEMLQEAGSVAKLLLGDELTTQQGQIHDYLNDFSSTDEFLRSLRTKREQALGYALVAIVKQLEYSEADATLMARAFWHSNPNGDQIDEIVEREHGTPIEDEDEDDEK